LMMLLRWPTAMGVVTSALAYAWVREDYEYAILSVEGFAGDALGWVRNNGVCTLAQ
jgi:hypothetical protein